MSPEQQALALRWGPMARLVARRFCRRSTNLAEWLPDFEQEAILMLCLCAKRWSPATGVAFSTYSYPRCAAAVRDLAGRVGRIHRTRRCEIATTHVVVLEEAHLPPAPSDMSAVDAFLTVAAFRRWAVQRHPSVALDRGLHVFARRVMDGAELEEIAVDLGVTKQRVHQLETKMRARFAEWRGQEAA